MTDCSECDGSGLIPIIGEPVTCSICNGTGKVKERVSLFGKVPDEDNKEDE